ncbi:MAG: amidohydrolase family protein [Pseudomonadota bacterium]|uniref:amidohydrolase n=1 Tax=Phenylobacterium sp. TaxID=1871053 RepID=UPI0025E94E35|nr:amidohydrolase family protein [Phenylobacterium sp.]MBT9470406.1 amidohydrolase [Phenylobacterium sp.]
MIASIVAAFAGLAALAPAALPADTVYVHGVVITVDDAHPKAQAVAVRDGKILAVGSDAQIKALKGPATRVVDLAGKTMVPGFVDGHSHIADAVMGWNLADLSPPPVGTVHDIAGLQAAMRAALAKPGDGLLLGTGYDDSLLVERRHPTGAELDAVSATRSVCVFHVSGHLAVCNSPAMKQLGFVKGAPNPPGGVIARDAAGEPTGLLEEQAVFAVFSAMTPTTPEAAAKSLDEIQTFYASLGYTTAQDGQTASPATLELLLKAQADKRLKIDIAAYPKWTLVEKMVASRGIKIGGPYENRLKFAGVKITEDGSPQGKTAYLDKPYFHPPHGAAADYRGYPIMPQAELDGWYDKFAGLGWQVQTHCNGDACIDMLIKAVEKAEAAHPGFAATRPVVIHSQVTRPDQLAAYKRLGLFPSFFAEHTFYWGDWHRDETLGADRAAFISPTAAALKAGLHFSLHTDAPVVPPAPMHVLWSAVNRTTRSGQVLGADQRISPMDALRAVTIWPAWQHFDEASRGSITVGKKADLVVLGANPLSIDPAKIKDIAVITTIKDGQAIYEAGKTVVARTAFAQP